jgi:ring-1,2-phenylacetyl-CoA epoxidase subunit PaaE
VTTLPLRDVRFDLDADDIAFCWNRENPAFSLQTDMISFLAISFERFIVAAVDEAMPLIEDPETREEARSFLDQEARHASWHREHVRAISRHHPGLVDVLASAIACFDRLTATKSLPWRLAFIADLEATFTPWFKMLLDNDRVLFGSGDERVASLFLWHFVEEVEHRSHGLLIFNAVVPRRWYRTAVLPSILRELNRILTAIVDGFNTAVPAEERGADARILLPVVAVLDRMRWLPAARRRLAGIPEIPDCYLGVSGPDRKAAGLGVLRSQLPTHDPGDQPLPDFARQWFSRYEAGGDIAHWYTGEHGAVSPVSPVSPA